MSSSDDWSMPSLAAGDACKAPYLLCMYVCVEVFCLVGTKFECVCSKSIEVTSVCVRFDSNPT